VKEDAVTTVKEDAVTTLRGDPSLKKRQNCEEKHF
jgi:hypothetical protein